MYLALNSKIVFMFIMCFLLVGTVSAFEFDNRLKSYDPLTEIIIIEDRNLIFADKELVKVQLMENTYECGVECSAIWNVTIYRNDDNFLGDLVFEKVKGGQGVSGHKFEFISSYRDMIVEDFEKDCKVLDELGWCTRIKLGEHTEKVPVWTTFNPERKLPVGNYIIKLTGTKKWEDSADWIATFYGQEIRQWAFWASSSPTSYWNFNEVSGATQAEDFLGLNNMTRLSTTLVGFVPGILNNAINMNGTTPSKNVFNTSGRAETTFELEDFTLAYWINSTGSVAGDMMGNNLALANGWGIGRQPSGINNFGNNNSLIIDTGISVTNSNWSRVVWVREGTGSNEFKVYINGRNTNNGTLSADLDTLSHNFTINTPGSGQTSLDDLQMYKGFAWTLADVIFDYDGGVGREANVTQTVIVTLNSPINGSSFTSSSINFNASANPTSINLTNATIRIYDSPTNLFAISNISITGDVINESIFNINNFVRGTYFWNVQSCGIFNNDSSLTICSDAESNFTFSVVAIINQSVSFSNQTIEGSTESFILNLTFNSSLYSLSSAAFNYNNTIGASTVSGTGDNRIITSSKVIPGIATSTNKSFFWNVSFVDVSSSTSFFETTTLINQSVLNIGIDTCGVFTNRILNFTVRDEELQTFITDATIETAVSIFNQNREVLVANVSGNFTNPTTICLSINLTNTTTYSLDAVARYESPLHANEYHNIINASLTINSTQQNIILFDLNLTDSTDFQLTFTGSDFLPVENALVFVDRQYITENQFKTVELPITDANGQTILHLVRNDVIYNIRVLKNGIVLGNFESIIAFCQDFAIGDCTISLNAGTGTTGIFNYNAELGITFTSPSFNNNTRVVNFDFLTVDGTAKTVLMNVTRSDIFGNRTICEDSLLSSGGTLSCVVPANIDDADLLISVFVDTEQVIFKTIKLELTDWGVAGYLVLFVMSLSLIMMFSSTREGILIAVLLGFTAGVGLGIITSSVIGLGASGLWLIIIVLVGMWKLNKDRIQ